MSRASQSDSVAFWQTPSGVWLVLGSLTFGAMALIYALQQHRSPGLTPRRPVTDTYHGVQVVDDYRWLEDANAPAVREWVGRQNDRSRRYLDGREIRPYIEQRLTELLASPSARYSSPEWSSGTLFLLKFQPPAEQPSLVTLRSATNLASERVLLDLEKLGTNGSVSLDWFVPSPDARWVAVSLSEHGSELGTVRILDATTGREHGDRVPRVQGPTAGGSLAWDADATGFYYTRYPAPGERAPQDLSFFQQVYHHTLGKPVESDTYEIGKDFPRIAEIQLQRSPDGRRVLASVANGDGGDYAHYLRQPTGEWRQIARFEDRVVKAAFGRDPLYIEAGNDDAVYLLSRDHAPRGRVLRLGFEARDLSNATVIIPEPKEPKESFANLLPSASGLAVVVMNGGTSELNFFDFDSRKLRNVRADPGGRTATAVTELTVLSGDELIFREETFLNSPTWLRFNPSTDNTVQSLPISGSSRVDFGDVEVVRESAVSRDGTKVPLHVVRKKGTRLDGGNPTLLTGYGGFGISQEPGFQPADRLWLDQGGVIAVAHLRGGGEFGEDWHEAGRLTRKQNVFDDFAACADLLIRSNYTRASRLAIEGGSNGGLLMGAALTQRPELYGAVVSHVGIYDMLRVELDPNGLFNTTEFGSVKDPAQFRALHAYSPYHHVTNGVAYPAVLFLTGDHDGRVNPAHSRKMTARLQAASPTNRPVYLRTSSGTGHGLGTALSEAIQQKADVYTFLFDQLGIPYSLIDRGPWSGAVTPTSAVVKARVAPVGARVRLVISENASLTPAIYPASDQASTNRYNLVELAATGLKPNTQYHYALEINGRLEPSRHGRFHTFPTPGPASFQFAFASCAKTGSTLDTFDRIREDNPLFFLHMGDFHYLDIRTNSVARFRAGYDTVLASPQQSELFRNVPIAYIWDDHDFGGNGSDERAKSEKAARQTYLDYVPHYPLVFDGEGPISQSFSVGRVKFLLTDLRSHRRPSGDPDNARKTILGREQKDWLKRELLAANGSYPLIVWMSPVPWIGKKGANVYGEVRSDEFGYFHHTNLIERSRARTNRAGAKIPAGEEDHWSVYTTERREIADFIRDNHIRGLCILHGDSHMLAADDGSNSDYATGGGAPIPVMCGGPLDQEPSLKGGPYSQGIYRMKRGEGGFGWMTVDDRGDHLDVSYSGRNNRNEEKVSLKFRVEAKRP